MSLTKQRKVDKESSFPTQLVRFLFFMRWMGYLYVWCVHSRFQWWKKQIFFLVLPTNRYQPRRPILSASIGVSKTLVYSSRIQTTCTRKHNEASQGSYLTTTLAGAVS